jgi:DNA-binding NarL/FixJ family response regulator
VPQPAVVIADDHPAYRAGLARLLRASGVDVVAEAANAEAAIRAAEEHGADVVVLDLNMPGLSGLEATRRLAPATRVLILTVSARDDELTEALSAGAHGYLLKDEPVEDIVAAIQTA